MSRTWWALWVVAGGVLAGLWLGPARDWSRQSGARELVSRAIAAEAQAEHAQAAAAEANARATAARRTARAEATPENIRRAATLTTDETRRYKEAQAAWQKAAALYGDAQTLGDAENTEQKQQLRLRESAALIGAGQVSTAATNLEQLLEEASNAGDKPGARAVRMQLARAYYHGAWLMRQDGRPEDQWRLLSERARQHARVLAEDERTGEEGARTDRATIAAPPARDGDAIGSGASTAQANLEKIMDFERRGLGELEAMPPPSDCAGHCSGKVQLDGWPWQRPRRGRGASPKDARDGNGSGEGAMPGHGS